MTNDMNKGILTVLCAQVEMQAFVHLYAVLCLLLVFVIKVIGSYGVGHTTHLLAQLSLFFVSFDGLAQKTHTQTSLIHHNRLNSRLFYTV